jgi:hypothetical protein
MKLCTMHYTNERGHVLAVRKNVTEAERMRLINNPRWVTAFWTYWEKK